MSQTTQQAAGASSRSEEADAGNTLNELHGALAKVLANGIDQYPAAERERIVQDLERMVADGGSVQYAIRLMPGQSLRVRCYAVSASAAEDPVLLFEVEADGAIARRLLN